MKIQFLHKSKSLIAVVAAFAFTTSLPLASLAGGYGDEIVKKVIVKDHKVKVKTVGGKAKIKNKPYGKEKVKVKGWSGDTAIAIAQEAARERASQQYAIRSPYGK